ncbi:Mobile element protein [hydrothermal vent metagenome]|uniref:Mobile element protein n=1 Tax=hydrothermal vent metagenome TaxID=652676 RepID=A0A3B1BQV4_9ZZZZ
MAMYIDIVPNRKSPPAILLRESIRQGKKIVKRTIANLSSLSIEQAQGIRRILKGEQLVQPEAHFDILSSRAHGHVDAVLFTIRKLRLDKLIATRRCKERDLVIAMIASRILGPESKPALSRSWENTTLGELLEVEKADEDELYAAMDWLYERQERIENKLAKRHLQEGGRVLYDLSSSYFEGTQCPLAERGYSRDQKKGKLQVNYGLLTDDRGCPVSISVFPGNTSDSTTLLPQVERLQDAFNLKSVVLVGDRGMISQKQVDELKGHSGMDWITALKTGAIRKLMDAEAIQLTLFDERNLFEFTHQDFPGEKLVACRNPELAYRRKHKREALLKATTEALEKIQGMIARGRLKETDKIGVRVGRVINQHKMAKHFKLEIVDNQFSFEVDAEKVKAEAALDGIYVIRTSVTDGMSAEDVVRHYKALSQVERAFRSIKTMDLDVRPIHHYQEQRVRAHLFLCMLAYYVKWHMMEAWRPLLFADEDQQAKQERDPVAPAKRSVEAESKVQSKQLPDGSPVHSFQSLLRNLATIVRNICQSRDTEAITPAFTIDTQRTQNQQKAFQLLKAIKM